MSTGRKTLNLSECRVVGSSARRSRPAPPSVATSLVIKVIIIYVLERKIKDLKIRGVVYASSKTFGKTEHFLAAVLQL